jgi:hypothetical protein
LVKKLKVFIDGSTNINSSKDYFGQFENQLFRILHASGLLPTNIEDADLFISVNHSNQAYKKYKSLGREKIKAILIRSEPIAVFPAQYTKRIVNKYDFVITLGQKEEILKNHYYVEHPYSYLPNPNLQMTKGSNVKNILVSEAFNKNFDLISWNKREIIVSMIASNKVSCIKDNNYDLRRSYARVLRAHFLRVYGDLWGASFCERLKHRLAVLLFSVKNLTFPNINSIYGEFFRKYTTYYGPVDDKHVIIKDSKFSLVVENSNQYISEKIFDAMMCGSIPIYFGPNLDDLGIPGKDIAVLYKGPAEKLEDYIMNLTDTDIENYLSSIRKFLQSENFIDVWLEETVYRKIANKIISFYG